MATRDFDREGSRRRIDEDEDRLGRGGERGYDDPRGWSGREGWGHEASGREGYGGPYRGRGPQGYRRSDERIREDVAEILTWHGQIDASDVEVAVHDGEVALRGAVDSRRTRRLTEEAVEDIPGVRDVLNQLRVSERRAAPGGVSEPGRGMPTAPASRAGERLQLRGGMEVVGSDGDDVGRVKEVRDNDFLLERSMRRDVYVPFSAIMHVAENRVTVSIPAERVDEMGWASPEALDTGREQGAPRSTPGEPGQPRPSTPTAVAASGRTQEQFLARITEGLDVCDRTRDKIGTVGKVHRPVGVASRAGGRSRTSGESYLEVDTGFLGLGKTPLYVPASSIRDVTTDGVLLDIERDRVDRMGWDERPSSIPD